MGKIVPFLLVTIFVLAVVPPRLELEFPAAVFCFAIKLGHVLNGAIGQFSTGDFDPSEPVVGPARLKTLRATMDASVALLQSRSSLALPIIRVERTLAGLRCLTYRPVGVNGALPTLVYFHGGGYTVGRPEWWDADMMNIAHDLKIAVVNVDYPLSPETKFPEPVLASVRVVEWIMSEEGRAQGFDGSRVMMSGDSAGGGMTAAVSTFLIQNAPDKAVNLIGNVLLYPYLDLLRSHPSSYLFASGYDILTAKSLLWFAQQYVRDARDYLNPLASPIYADNATLSKMPATLILTAEMDALRDEGEAYGRKLVQAGVSCSTTRYNATVHAFIMMPSSTKNAGLQEMKTFLAGCAFSGQTAGVTPKTAESDSSEL